MSDICLFTRFLSLSFLMLCVRSHVKHKCFEIQLGSLNLSAELPKCATILSKQSEKRKGTRQVHGSTFMQPQTTGIFVDLEEFPVLPQHIVVSQAYKDATSLWPPELLTLLSSFPVTTPSCPLVPTKVPVLGLGPARPIPVTLICCFRGLKYQCNAQGFF